MQFLLKACVDSQVSASVIHCSLTDGLLRARPIPADSVHSAIDGRPEAEVRTAVSATIQRRPADVLAFFRGCLKRTIAVIPVTPRRGVLPLVRDDDDPFAPY